MFRHQTSDTSSNSGGAVGVATASWTTQLLFTAFVFVSVGGIIGAVAYAITQESSELGSGEMGSGRL